MAWKATSAMKGLRTVYLQTNSTYTFSDKGASVDVMDETDAALLAKTDGIVVEEVVEPEPSAE